MNKVKALFITLFAWFRSDRATRFAGEVGKAGTREVVDRIFAPLKLFMILCATVILATCSISAYLDSRSVDRALAECIHDVGTKDS